MKLSAIVLLITSMLLAIGNLIYPMGARTTILLIIFGIILILNFVFVLENKTNKKLLWIHVIPLIAFIGILLYHRFYEGYVLLYTITNYAFLIVANILNFCALLVHIDHSIKQQRIKDLEAEIAQLKG